jgi:hypothetical protein
MTLNLTERSNRNMLSILDSNQMLGLPWDFEAEAATERWALFGTYAEGTMSIDDSGVDCDDDFPLILAVPTYEKYPTRRHSATHCADRTTAPHNKRPFVLRPRCRYQAQSHIMKTSGAMPLSSRHNHPLTAPKSTVDSSPRVVESTTDAIRNQQTLPFFYHSPVRLGIRREYHSSRSFSSPRIPPLRVRCQAPLHQEQLFGRCESRYNIATARSLPLIPLLC